MDAVDSELRPKLELADILRQHAESYCLRHPVSPEQAQVLRHLRQCRTAVLGGHVDRCDSCGYVRIWYNSCRDRHCPKCQAIARAEWIEARLERLLPVPYFHVVFTLPDELNPVCLQNRRELYGILFECAAETLLQIAADPKHLGGQVGFTAILHTWGQNLPLHPHLHCVVTGGGLSQDGKRWVAARDDFLVSVKVLGRLFRGKFLARLQEFYQEGRLQLKGTAAPLSQAGGWRRWLAELYRQDWVVYAKPPFGGPEQVFGYLGRYSHRVAIANGRLIQMQDGKVSFWYKDYADGSKSKVMTVEAEEFIRRFLLHVLPKGFTRIRHYGLAAGRNLNTKFVRCRELLGKTPSFRQTGPSQEPLPDEALPQRPKWADRVLEWTGNDPLCCPRCRGPLTRSELPATLGHDLTRQARSHAARVGFDSS